MCKAELGRVQNIINPIQYHLSLVVAISTKLCDKCILIKKYVEPDKSELSEHDEAMYRTARYKEVVEFFNQGE